MMLLYAMPILIISTIIVLYVRALLRERRRSPEARAAAILARRNARAERRAEKYSNASALESEIARPKAPPPL